MPATLPAALFHSGLWASGGSGLGGERWGFWWATVEQVPAVGRVAERGGDGDGGWEPFTPVLDSATAGQGCTGPYVAAHDEFQQTFGGGLGGQGELVLDRREGTNGGHVAALGAEAEWRLQGLEYSRT